MMLMKNFLSLFFIFSFFATPAQQKSHVLDKEKLFSPDEITRLDSLLQQYHQRTANIILIATDSADINDPAYKNELFWQFIPDTTTIEKMLMLLMSRKSQAIRMVASRPLLPYISQEQLLEIIGTGIPSIKEKRREEGATIICKKAMELLDGLPKKN
jgi:uncharacterized membrane protein YgcG